MSLNPNLWRTTSIVGHWFIRPGEHGPTSAGRIVRGVSRGTYYVSYTHTRGLRPPPTITFEDIVEQQWLLFSNESAWTKPFIKMANASTAGKDVQHEHDHPESH